MDGTDVVEGAGAALTVAGVDGFGFTFSVGFGEGSRISTAAGSIERGPIG